MYSTNDVLENTLFHIFDGQLVLNVTHWRLAAGSPDQLESQLILLNQILVLRWRAIMDLSTDDLQLIQVRTRVITGKTGVDPVEGTGELVYGGQRDDPVIPPSVGSFATDRLPTYCSVRVIKRSDRAGRRYRGAMRVAGVVEEKTARDQLLVPDHTLYQTAIAAFFVDVIVPLTGLTWEPVVFSKKDFFQTPAISNPSAFTGKITFPPVSLVLGTQNSRKQSGVILGV